MRKRLLFFPLILIAQVLICEAQSHRTKDKAPKASPSAPQKVDKAVTYSTLLDLAVTERQRKVTLAQYLIFLRDFDLNRISRIE